MSDAADRLEAARRAWPWPARDTPATDEVPLSMWPAYELIDALEARVAELEAALTGMASLMDDSDGVANISYGPDGHHVGCIEWDWYEEVKVLKAALVAVSAKTEVDDG